jgi:paraquat-inducible protein B
MTDPQTNPPETAHVQIKKRLSAIWLIPFVALAIGLWMIVEQWENQGPLITITMGSAQGLEENKTKIKTHNVDIGMVKTISLKEDTKGVVVTARIDKEAARLLNKGSQVWVVSPRISNDGISGLNTILSGVYIELTPGLKKSSTKTEFIALERPPVTPAGTPGLHITLSSKDKVAYSIGDIVQFKGINVGKFEDVDIDFDKKEIRYDVFINAPYHKLITNQTRFWNNSGLELDLSANGINVKADNLQSLLSNSVSFDEPTHIPKAEDASQRDSYPIYANQDEATRLAYEYSVEYIVLMSESVRGLNAGAPVEFRGINVGKVISINDVDEQSESLLNQDYQIPVLVSIQPGKLGLSDSQQGVDKLLAEHSTWVNKGLKAKLKTGNILTGRLFIELQYYPDLAANDARQYDNHPVIPSVLDDFTSLADNAKRLLDKFNNLPIEELAVNASTTIKTFNGVAKNLETASVDLAEMMNEVNKQHIIANLNDTLVATQALAKTYSVGSASHDQILAMLSQVTELVKTADTLANDFSGGSETYDNLNNTLIRVNTLMRELQPLLLNLNQQPNSLIFSGPQPSDIEPKARN